MALFILALILQLHSSYIAFYYIIQAKYPEMQKLLRSSYKPEDNQQYMHAYSNNKNKKPNRLNSRQKSKQAYAKKFFERRNALQMQVRQKIIKQKKQRSKKVENKIKLDKPRRKNQQLQHSLGSSKYGQNRHQLQITDYKHNYYGVDLAKCNKIQRVQERWVRGREDANCQKDNTTKTTKTKQGLKFEREKQIKHDPNLQKLILKNNIQSKFCKLLMKSNFTEHEHEPGPYINVSKKYKDGHKQYRHNRFLNNVTNPEQNSSVQLKKDFQFDIKSKYLDQNMEIGKTLNSNNVRGYRNNEFEQEMRGRSKTTKCEIDEKLRSKLAMIILNQREKARQRDNTNQQKKQVPNLRQFNQQQSFKQELDLIINESSSKSVSQHDSSFSDVKIVDLRRSQQNQCNNYFDFEQKIKQITEQNKIGRIQRICNNRRLVDSKEEEEHQKCDEQDKQSENMYPFLDSWLKNPQQLRQNWNCENHLVITQNRYNSNPLTLLHRQDQKIEKGRQRQKQENSYSIWSFDNQFEEVEMIQDNVCEQLNIQNVRNTNREQPMHKHQDKNKMEQEKQQHSQMICAICQTNIPHNLWKFAIFYSKSKINSQHEYYNFYEIFHNQQQDNGQTQQNNSHEVPMLLHCGHSYHRMCLQEWFNYKTVCPLCKAEHYNDNNNRNEQSDNMISFSYESNSDEDVDFEFLHNGAIDENIYRYNHQGLSSSQASHRNLSQQNRYNIQMRNYLQQSQQVEYSLNQYSALLQTYQARINEQIQQSRERVQNALNRQQQQHNDNSLLLPSPPLSQFQVNQISYDVNLAEQSSFSSIHLNADVENLSGRVQRVERNERSGQSRRFADEQSQQQL